MQTEGLFSPFDLPSEVVLSSSCGDHLVQTAHKACPRLRSPRTRPCIEQCTNTMTPEYRFSALPYSPRGPGELNGRASRASRPSRGTYPQASSYFAPPPRDVERISPPSFAQEPNHAPVRSRLTDAREYHSVVPAAVAPSLPSHTFFTSTRDAIPYVNDQFFGFPTTDFESELPQLFSCPPSTAVRRPNFAPVSITTPSDSRPSTRGNPLRQHDQPFEPLINRANHEEDIYGKCA